ncbi:hypothetical protein Tco_0724642 [Tanacetum coccineum]
MERETKQERKNNNREVKGSWVSSCVRSAEWKGGEGAAKGRKKNKACGTGKKDRENVGNDLWIWASGTRHKGKKKLVDVDKEAVVNNKMNEQHLWTLDSDRHIKRKTRIRNKGSEKAVIGYSKQRNRKAANEVGQERKRRLRSKGVKFRRTRLKQLGGNCWTVIVEVLFWWTQGVGKRRSIDGEGPRGLKPCGVKSAASEGVATSTRQSIPLPKPSDGEMAPSAPDSALQRLRAHRLHHILSAKEVEERESIKLVKKVMLDQEVDKIVEGEEGDFRFLDDMNVDNEKPDTRLDQRSQKESLEDDNDDDESIDDTSVKKESSDKSKGADHYLNLEQSSDCTNVLRTNDVPDSQNKPIPEATLTSLVGAQKLVYPLVNSPVIEQRGSSEIPHNEVIPTELSVSREMLNKVVEPAPLGHTSEGLSYGDPSLGVHLRRVVASVTQHCNRMIKTIKKSFVHRSEVESLCEKIADTINNVDPPLVVEGTRKVVKANLRRVIKEEIHKETTNVKYEFCSMVTKELVATTHQQIEKFLRNYMHTHAITLQPPSCIPILKLQQKLYIEMKDSPQS